MTEMQSQTPLSYVVSEGERSSNVQAFLSKNCELRALSTLSNAMLGVHSAEEGSYMTRYQVLNEFTHSTSTFSNTSFNGINPFDYFRHHRPRIDCLPSFSKLRHCGVEINCLFALQILTCALTITYDHTIVKSPVLSAKLSKFWSRW